MPRDIKVELRIKSLTQGGKFTVDVGWKNEGNDEAREKVVIKSEVHWVDLKKKKKKKEVKHHIIKSPPVRTEKVWSLYISAWRCTYLKICMNAIFFFKNPVLVITNNNSALVGI